MTVYDEAELEGWPCTRCGDLYPSSQALKDHMEAGGCQDPLPRTPAGTIDMGMLIYGKSVSSAVKEHLCIDCGQSVESFRDAISAKEYQISGLCQQCQDNVFAPPDPELPL